MEAEPMPEDPIAPRTARLDYPIRPRKIPLPFGPEIPRYWFFGSPTDETATWARVRADLRACGRLT